MEISIEIDEDLLGAIDLASNIQKISRSDAFREALETWVSHMPKSDQCLVEFAQLEFDPDFVLEVDRPGPEAFSTAW